jgi:hypothetical protein
VFNIYIYINDLEYEIDCENNDKCFVITKKGEKHKESEESDPEKTSES